MSEYLEGMTRARSDMLGTIAKTDKQIAAIYDEAARDLARKAAGQKNGSLTQRWQLDMSRSLDERMRQLNGDLTATVLASATNASKLPGNATADWLGLVLARTGQPGTGDDFRSVFSRTSDEALRQVVNGAAYLDSKSLSRRIWQNNARAREGINKVIQQGVAQKKSAFAIAKDLERYVNPKAWEDYDWRKVYPDLPSWLSGQWTSVEKHAQTVARTSINHAYHLAMVESAKGNPFAEAIHWELSPQHWERQVRPFGADICDDYAMHDEGLGVGNWPIGGLPLPHARCLCVQYPVVTKSLDACATELRGWLDGDSNPAMDAAFADWKSQLSGSQPMAQPTAAAPQPAAAAQQAAKPVAEERTRLMERVAQQPWAQAMQPKDREAIYQVLNNATNDELRFFAEQGVKFKGQFYGPGSGAYYQPLTQTLHMNVGLSDKRSAAIGFPETDVRVFFHEVGHVLDYQGFQGTQVSLELGQDFRDALNRDAVAHANKVLTAAGTPPIKSLARISPTQKATLNADLCRDMHLKNAVSDITGGLTNCRVQGPYGHPAGYWQTQPASTEAIAHMYEAKMVKGQKRAIMEEYFPEAYNLYCDKIDKLTKGAATGGGTP